MILTFKQFFERWDENYKDKSAGIREIQLALKQLKTYQRTPISIKPIKKLAGRIGVFIENKTYILYRGIALRNEEGYIDSYPLDKIKKDKYFFDEKEGISWTKSLGQAEHFAYGNTTWMGNKKKYDKNDYFDKTKYGLILKEQFKPKDILFDLDYMEKNLEDFRFMADFAEDEVICLSRKKYKIFKIIEPS